MTTVSLLRALCQTSFQPGGSALRPQGDLGLPPHPSEADDPAARLSQLPRLPGHPDRLAAAHGARDRPCLGEPVSSPSQAAPRSPCQAPGLAWQPESQLLGEPQGDNGGQEPSPLCPSFREQCGLLRRRLRFHPPLPLPAMGCRVQVPPPSSRSASATWTEQTCFPSLHRRCCCSPAPPKSDSRQQRGSRNW